MVSSVLNSTWFRVAKNVVTSNVVVVAAKGVALTVATLGAVVLGGPVAGIAAGVAGCALLKYGGPEKLPTTAFVGYVNQAWDNEDVERYVEKVNFKHPDTIKAARDVFTGVPYTEREELFKYIEGTSLKNLTDETAILSMLKEIAKLPGATRAKSVQLLKEVGYRSKDIGKGIDLLVNKKNIPYVKNQLDAKAILTTLEQLKLLGFKSKEIDADKIKALTEIKNEYARSHIVALIVELKLPKEDISRGIETMADIEDRDDRITVVNKIKMLALPEKDRLQALKEVINIEDTDEGTEAADLIHSLGLPSTDVINLMHVFSEIANEKENGNSAKGIKFFKQLKDLGFRPEDLLTKDGKTGAIDLLKGRRAGRDAFCEQAKLMKEVSKEIKLGCCRILASVHREERAEYVQLGNELIKPNMTSEQKVKVWEILETIPQLNRKAFVNNVKKFANNDGFAYYELIVAMGFNTAITPAQLIGYAYRVHDAMSKENFPSDNPEELAKLFKIVNNAIKDAPNGNYRKFDDFIECVEKSIGWGFSDPELKWEAFETLAKSTTGHQFLIGAHTSWSMNDAEKIKFWKAINAIRDDKLHDAEFNNKLADVFDKLSSNLFTRVLVYLEHLLSIDSEADLTTTLTNLNKIVKRGMNLQDLEKVLAQLDLAS